MNETRVYALGIYMISSNFRWGMRVHLGTENNERGHLEASRGYTVVEGAWYSY